VIEQPSYLSRVLSRAFSSAYLGPDEGDGVGRRDETTEKTIARNKERSAAQVVLVAVYHPAYNATQLNKPPEMHFSADAPVTLLLSPSPQPLVPHPQQEPRRFLLADPSFSFVSSREPC